ncbi:putative meiotic recombination protein dmc1 [Golovinomyces cichoracearum]|uniref:Putative meiotic recombination protein dmc1 n=1 Tax=Golovinomyces cichoracearum TaxID=62708 RepID=A0A420J9C1_9PEZI|nr:putative meiotic recombination protein dmc1 [Golovinomyces cichoracearum]
MIDHPSNEESENYLTPDKTSPPLSLLPKPRSRPLRPGCRKEDTVRQYLDQKILNVSRRYAKKFQPREEQRVGDVTGYVNMDQVASDIGRLADVVWLTGTPNLQVHYLLNIAGMFINFLPAFPPAPEAIFLLLKKMDYAFSCLLKGKNISTDEVLPGFSGGNDIGLSKTDMVRLRSLVEETRVLTVKLLGNNDFEDRNTSERCKTSSACNDQYDMDLASVYEQTIFNLGELLEPSFSLQNQQQSFIT